jgi:hypothetical protein
MGGWASKYDLLVPKIANSGKSIVVEAFPLRLSVIGHPCYPICFGQHLGFQPSQ